MKFGWTVDMTQNSNNFYRFQFVSVTRKTHQIYYTLERDSISELERARVRF